MTSDRAATPRLSNDLGGDVGVDVKYGVTQNLTADLTYNTDFAQVEADEQQVNLTRFSLFFPEKREFFLENQGDLHLRRRQRRGDRANATTARHAGPVLQPAHRPDGGSTGHRVPIDAGGRLTGRVGRYSLGVAEHPDGRRADRRTSRPTNFSVVRVKRDILRRSSIGVLATIARVGSELAPAPNQSLRRGRHFRLLRQPRDQHLLGANAHRRTSPATTRAIAPSSTTTAIATGCSSSGWSVGANFNPEVGFVRRDGHAQELRAAPLQPAAPVASGRCAILWNRIADYIENGAGRLETRTVDGEFADRIPEQRPLQRRRQQLYEFLPAPFNIARV